MDTALEKVTEAVQKLLGFWKDGKYKLGYEAQYRRMVATRKFFDSSSWDNLEKELESLGEFWLGKLRKDKNLKEYYSLRAEHDRLEVLLK